MSFWKDRNMNNQDGEGVSMRKIIPGIVVIFALSLISLQGGRRCRESVLSHWMP